jgi:glycosyltransferase involved in cell wall biosynthesis
MIDIIIPTCKRPQDVKPLAREARVTAGIDVHIIATCEAVSASRNRNIGLDMATSPIRIMMDDDITGLPPGWARELVKVLEDHPECVMVSPQLLRPDGSYGLMMGCQVPNPPGTGAQVIGADRLLTACIAIRADDLRFDENFVGSGWEDCDYSHQQNERYPGCTRMVQFDVQVIHKNEMKNQGGENWNANKRYYREKWGKV